MEDFHVLRKLGQGGQGTTLQVQRKRDGFAFVCKQVVCDSIAAANYALKEAKTLQRLEHIGVCRYEDVFLSEQKQGRDSKLVVCIIMEFCERGDLAGAIGSHRDRRAPIPERQLAKWLLEVMQALAYIHAAGVLHRDLKSPNIFITLQNTAKLGDFGLARQVTGDIRTKVGTPCYLAPEVLQSDSYAEPADAWGVGCIAFEAMTLSFLWDRKGLLAVQVMSEALNAQKLPLHFSTEFRCMVAQLLDKDPIRRPSVADCIATLSRCVGAGGQVPPVQQAKPPPPVAVPNVAAGQGARPAGTEASQKPRQRKRDEAIGSVHAAVEAAKLAAKQAMQAAGMGMNAIHAQQARKERPVLGEMRRALPPQEQQPHPLAPQPKQLAKDPDDSPARPHRPPAPQLTAEGELMEGDIAQYEAALQRHRREQEGVRRVGQGGRDLSASGYPLVLKNGLEIFVSDEDLLAGMAPFMNAGAASDEDVVKAALRNNGFHNRYIQIEESPRNEATIASRMRDLLREQRSLAAQPAPAPAPHPVNAGLVAGEGEEGATKRVRTWGSFQMDAGRRLHTAKEAVGEGILGVLNHVGEAVHTFKTDVKALANLPPSSANLPPSSADIAPSPLQKDSTAKEQDTAQRTTTQQAKVQAQEAATPTLPTGRDADERRRHVGADSPDLPQPVPSMTVHRGGSGAGEEGRGAKHGLDAGTGAAARGLGLQDAPKAAHTHTHPHVHPTTHPQRGGPTGRPPPAYDEYRESQSHFARMTLDTSSERQEGESGTHEGGGGHAAMYVKDVTDGHRAAMVRPTWETHMVVGDPHGSVAAMEDLLRTMGHNDQASRPLVHSTAPRDKGPGVAGDAGAGAGVLF